jgi:hypothetical protein
MGPENELPDGFVDSCFAWPSGVPFSLQLSRYGIIACLVPLAELPELSVNSDQPYAALLPAFEAYVN